MSAAGKYLVTGGSGGIGLELVKQLVERGDSVYATVRSRKPDDAIGQISGQGTLTVIDGIDIGDDGCGSVLAAAMKDVDLDVIINNAGLIGSKDVPGGDQNLDKVTTDSMRTAFEVNALGILRVQQALGDNVSTHRYPRHIGGH
eukprot:2342296-Prymnesium_polylepis.1